MACQAGLVVVVEDWTTISTCPALLSGANKAGFPEHAHVKDLTAPGKGWKHRI